MTTVLLNCLINHVCFDSVIAEVVVSLDATDDFLKARVMNLPESVVAGTHNTEEGRLAFVEKQSVVTD